MPLPKIEQYESIIESYVTGQKSQAIEQIAELADNKLTDFVLYCCDQLESNTARIRPAYTMCRFNALDRINELLIARITTQY